ncbi:MAG: phosphogluconate dehydrogenase (NAD(+)-dependent, decarboxylating) [Candidatus Zixiibacteriota bacterium]
MRLAMIGLGRMGMNMTRRLLGGGHEVVAFNKTADAVEVAVGHGAIGAQSIDDVIAKLTPPRVVWLMVPSGGPTEQSVVDYCERLSPGDLLIDGGNSRWTDSVRRHDHAAARKIHYMDIGTSGGIWGLKVGYCLMAGGSPEAFRMVEPALKTLAPPNGYRHVGPAGAGHFSKMIHNGIEYGMMQAYAEGFELLRASGFNYDLADLATLWNQGSVVRSWLLELAASAFQKDGDLSSLRGYVDDSGEGRWTVIEAVERAVPAPVLTAALYTRFASRQDNSFGARVLAALRNEFGGHAVKTSDKHG